MSDTLLEIHAPEQVQVTLGPSHQVTVATDETTVVEVTEPNRVEVVSPTSSNLIIYNYGIGIADGQATNPDSPFSSSLVPPTPAGVVILGGFSTVSCSWDAPGYFNHSHAEIWASEANLFSTASCVQSAPGTAAILAVDPGKTYYYWIRFVSLAGVAGPLHTGVTNGTVILTGQYKQEFVDTLSGFIGEASFTTSVTNLLNGIGDNATAISQETTNRIAAIATETSNREAAITTEQTARIAADAALASDVTALQVTVNNPTTGLAATASALSSLDSRVTSAEGTLTSQSSTINALENTVDGPNGVAATAAAVSSLTTRVDSAETTMTSQSSAITALETTVNHPTLGIAASASALSSLETRVTTNEGDISSQASSLTSLNTQVGDNSATLTAHGNSLNGLEAQWTIKTDVNGKIAGYGLANYGPTATGGESSFNIWADRFTISHHDEEWSASTGYAAEDTVRPTAGAGAYVYVAQNAGASGPSEPTWPTSEGQTVADGSITWITRSAAAVAPFVVEDGRVRMDSAYITDLSADRIGAGTIDASVTMSALNYTGGSINIGSGNFTVDGAGGVICKNLIITDALGNTVLSSGSGANWDYIANRPTSLSALNASEGSKLAGVASGATVNRIFRQLTEPFGTTGDIWVTTTTPERVYMNLSGVWYLAGNNTSNTSQLTDGAGLGTTAIWTGVSGAGKPEDGATNNKIFRQTSQPTSGMSAGDFWVKTNTPVRLYEYNGSSWVQIGDRTIENTAASIVDQGAFAKLNKIDSTNIPTYIANLSVDTLQIANNAVTVPQAATAQNWEVYLGLNLTGDYPVVITASITVSTTSRIRLTRLTGTTTYTLIDEVPSGGTLACKAITDTPIPGIHSYRLFSDNQSNTNGATIVIQTIKR